MTKSKVIKFKRYFNKQIKSASSNQDDDISPYEYRDPLDRAAIQTERSLNLLLTTQRAISVERAKYALKRVESGEFGCCINCEEPIDEKRLEAYPYALRCIACQELAESKAQRRAYA